MPEINGETRLLAVIGHPIAHSLSPRIQNSFIEDARLNYAYMAFDVEPHELGTFISAARLMRVAGFNVTMPLKEAIVPHIDQIDDEAVRYGAVNTVAVRDGRTYGYNTDGGGFLLSLARNGFDVPGGETLILGAGGSAKTIAMAIAEAGMRVRIASRRPLDESLGRFGIRHCAWGDIASAVSACRLLVNATPLGMQGYAEDFADLSFTTALPKGALVYDLIYAPRETALLKAARQAGLEVVNGLSHLVCQAALSFYHFTGVEVAEETVRRMIDDVL